MKEKYPSRARDIGRIAAEKLAEKPIDLNLKWPAAVNATIAQGEEAFRRLKLNRRLQRELKARAAARVRRPSFITSVVDQDVQESRDAHLDTLQGQSKGKRGQPPMLYRLRSVQIVVDRLRAEGVPFATGRNSRMNKLVREWLNEHAATSPDDRKSRRKQVSPDAVRQLLKTIKGLDV